MDNNNTPADRNKTRYAPLAKTRTTLDLLSAVLWSVLAVVFFADLISRNTAQTEWTTAAIIVMAGITTIIRSGIAILEYKRDRRT